MEYPEGMCVRRCSGMAGASRHLCPLSYQVVHPHSLCTFLMEKEEDFSLPADSLCLVSHPLYPPDSLSISLSLSVRWGNPTKPSLPCSPSVCTEPNPAV